MKRSWDESTHKLDIFRQSQMTFSIRRAASVIAKIYQVSVCLCVLSSEVLSIFGEFPLSFSIYYVNCTSVLSFLHGKEEKRSKDNSNIRIKEKIALINEQRRGFRIELLTLKKYKHKLSKYFDFANALINHKK